MKKYIIKILSFLLIIIIYGFINFLINSYFIQNEITGKSCETLIIGESHVKSGINPAMIPNCENIAQPAESIILSYYKLKKVHSFHKKELKNIFLSLGHYSISEVADIKFHDHQYADEFIYRAYPIMSVQQINTTGMDCRIYTKVFIKNMLLYPRKKHDSYVGFFSTRKTVKKRGNIDDRIKMHFFNEDKKVYNVSKNTMNYLDSIMDYCSKHQLNLYPIYIPIQKVYKERIPSQFNAPFEELKEKFKEKNIHLFDFHQIDIGDKYFSDFDHLNGKGADFVTQMLLDEWKKESPKSDQTDFGD